LVQFDSKILSQKDMSCVAAIVRSAVQLMSLQLHCARICSFPLFGEVELRLVRLRRAQSVELHSQKACRVVPSFPEVTTVAEEISYYLVLRLTGSVVQL